MSVQGVTFPDTSTVGGKPVKLNGMGVRIAYVFVKVYVAGLYLTTPTHDGKAATDADEPKRMQLQFLREVSHDEMVDAMKEGFSHTGTPALQPQFDQFASWFKEPLREGSQVTFDYVPGTGTTGTIAGKNAGTIPGPEFMRALWGIWLGDDPPNQALKDGLLGKG
ncbi:MAG TPA: chalcone isomerase family protein [Candidatus Binatia bacterium]|nr:chalcone isomerase family protein [Candidatus Binatia bacterium]